jgi:collagen type VII alpha
MRIDQIELSGSLSISASLATNPLVVNDDYLFVSNTGNVGIGTKTPTSKLVVTGSVAVRGGLRATTMSGSFTGSVKLSTIPLGTSETNIVLVNGGGNLVYRDNLSLTGAQGNQGPTGFQGAAGVAGAQGTTGAQGFQGAEGIVSGVTKILFGVAPPATVSTLVTFPSAFTSTPVVVITSRSAAAGVTSVTTTNFTWAGGAGQGIYWIAIN